jgi:sterol desaturase/sphingolipid hydroxylase (fatty acid hydroxylase superfamily)
MASKGAKIPPGSARADVLRASPRMFESDWLDRLSRVHHTVPLFVFVPIVSLMAAAGIAPLGLGRAAAWALLGYFLWTLTEYWMHRAVFHFEPRQGIGARLHWIIHGVHHDHPNDPMRLVMPPSVSVPLSALFFAAFALAFGTPAAYPLMAGFLSGYLAYDMLHYHLHHHVPRSRLGQWLRELHMRHHFQDDTRGFGISAPFWDHAFGTVPRRRRD